MVSPSVSTHYYIADSARHRQQFFDPMPDKPLTYKDVGVDIDTGNALVERIKPVVKRTLRPEVLADIGGFGGLFALPPDRYREPVLVSGTDGVGTKLLLAKSVDRHDTIGQDLVAMCVNDVLVAGAEPLLFLDYFACGRLDIDVASNVVGGIANACAEAGAALIGGETAEMPDLYSDGEYDLAGFCVGVVERADIIDGSKVAAGDALIGVASSGPHSNGYSLIRKVLDIATDTDIGGRPASEVLLEPTRIYVRSTLALLQSVSIHGMAHITGGGISENLPRMIAGDLHPEVDTTSWQQGEVFDWLAEHGNIELDEMRRTFNCGVGLIIAVAPDDLDAALQTLAAQGETAWHLGRIAAGAGPVRFL